jgi:HK97 gp10 family phage protein
MYRSRLPKIAAELVATMDGIAEGGAMFVSERAKQRVPVDTGKLRDAIHVERDEFASYAVVAGNSKAFYGHIVEHGSVHTPPHPFLVPALEESRADIEAAAAAALRKL